MKQPAWTLSFASNWSVLMARLETMTGGRSATTGVIRGRYALSVGNPGIKPPIGFSWVRLTDLARLESGHTPSRRIADYWGGDIPWIGIRDATANHGKIIFSTNQHITESGLANSSARLLPESTVCLSRTASVGYVVTMGVPMATSQDFINWVCEPGLSSKYLHYIFMCEQESVRQFAHGTTHQTVYYPEAKAFHVCIPSKAEQDRVVQTLSALDDKISTNERIVAICDELRRVSLEDEMLRSAPIKVPLSSIARFVNGRAFTKGATGTGRMVVRIAELNSGPSASTIWNELNVDDVHLAQAGDVLFAWSGSLTVARWFRPEAIINQHIFKVIPNSNLPTWLIYELVNQKLDVFRGIAADKATTMGHIQRRHLDELISAPDFSTIGNLDRKLGPLWQRALAAETENLTLAEMRDALLPRLLSGELRVTDAERLVEDAV
ncbi:MAG: restriction endonuclease subunit S [Actinophytocola sp.]|uniref:restriction endonuclease subunit S n=1 Tax=Actinophytocola sp. TaxID=1872138 RepID=UPI003C770372